MQATFQVVVAGWCSGDGAAVAAAAAAAAAWLFVCYRSKKTTIKQ